MVVHVETMLKMQERGAITFDYGNNLRGQVADLRGMKNAFDFPRLRAGLYPPAVFAAVPARSAGPHSRETLPISPPPTKPSSNCSRKRNT